MNYYLGSKLTYTIGELIAIIQILPTETEYGVRFPYRCFNTCWPNLDKAKQFFQAQNSDVVVTGSRHIPRMHMDLCNIDHSFWMRYVRNRNSVIVLAYD